MHVNPNNTKELLNSRNIDCREHGGVVNLEQPEA